MFGFRRNAHQHRLRFPGCHNRQMPFPGFRCLFRVEVSQILKSRAVEGGNLRVCRFPITLALALLLLTVSSSDAQQAKPLLQLQTSTAQSVFHIGERIPLTLTFSAADTNRYEITSSSSNRQGCMDYEDFEVTPSKGWADPLAIYYGGGCAGSFLSSLGVLSSKPTIVQHDLNEWIRFDQPGVYKLTVISHRVTNRFSLRSRQPPLPQIKLHRIAHHPRNPGMATHQTERHPPATSCDSRPTGYAATRPN